MKLNPEFRRNLWIELSPHRVILIGGFLGTLFIMVWQAPASIGGNFMGERANLFSSTVLASASMLMFILISIVWGGYQAGESILDELRSRTWDSQKMSALGPWQMTWGKLFGATILSWYGGLICLFVYLFSRAHTDSFPFGIGIICIAMAVIVQSVNLIVALVSTRLVKQIKGAHGLLTTVVSLAGIWYIYKGFGIGDGDNASVFWYGQRTQALDFLVISVTSLAAWSLFGLYRMMCIELKLATVPWAWAAFAFYLAFYIGGTLTDVGDGILAVLSVVGAVGFSISITASYLTLLIDFQDRLVLRRIRSYIGMGQWKRMFQELPLWCVSLAIAAAFSLLCYLLARHFPNVDTTVRNVGASAIPVWLLTSRNILILLFFSYDAKPNKPILMTLIYVLLLDLLIPGLLNISGFGTISWVASPPVMEKPLLSAVIAIIHILIISCLCWQRYQRNVMPH